MIKRKLQTKYGGEKTSARKEGLVVAWKGLSNFTMVSYIGFLEIHYEESYLLLFLPAVFYLVFFSKAARLECAI